MIVEQIWTGNAYRNFNYLIACDETGEALAIDPLDHRKCLALARDRGWEITRVVNTHEHGDHTGGNRAMLQATGAKLLAHHAARIANVDQALKAGDVIRVGHSAELQVLDTPGHTMSHVCLLAHAEQPALFSGDTLFNAGAGNCHNGGHPDELFGTFEQQLATLPAETQVYPGHDYIAHNLGFALDREPGNAVAAKLLEQVSGQDPAEALVTDLATEKDINVFFRLENPQVIERLRETNRQLPSQPSRRDVFLALRELRNRW
ncbi:MAG: MBL fold metallo-hydrolase [Gammaproteobacteria bacterium]|nr:MBL fold metallo-hydrolase [Gammaproteobacteria bacterium]NNF61815.1 hydroxyacylglutathione hydrolase [Gammaproteobacteria bacterium]NNM19739.1 hydroxyacylglutathione hydrolase [Gammaproteobacteria bacterium]